MMAQTFRSPVTLFMTSKGFTLIELMVAVAIISILASVTFMRTDLLQAETAIKSAAQQVVNAGKLARQQSISVKEMAPGVFPSYGLHFNRDENPGAFIVFANCRADNNEDGRVNEEDNFAYNGEGHEVCEDEMKNAGMSSGDIPDKAALIERHTLDHNVEITELRIVYPDGNSDTEQEQAIDKVSINFLRPEPTIWITDQENDEVVMTGYLEVTLEDPSSQRSKKVLLHSTGLIETIQ